MERSTYRTSLAPSDGVREILRTGTGVTLALMLVLCTVLTINRNSAHSAAQISADFAGLRVIGMMLMSVGALFALISAFLPKGIVTPAIGMFAHAAGGLSLTVAAAAELGSGYGLLWSIESVLQAAAMLSVTVAFVFAALVGCNARAFAPSVASFASGACTVSLIMLLMRITVSFSGVYSVGGFSYDYTRAEKYSDQLMWIFSTVNPDGGTAKDVLLAALLERISLAVVMLCLAVFFSNYSKQISVFATRLRLLDDIPVHTQMRSEKAPEPVVQPPAQPTAVEEKPKEERPAPRAQFRPKRTETKPAENAVTAQQTERPAQQPAQPRQARQSGFTPRPRREQQPVQTVAQPPQRTEPQPVQPRQRVQTEPQRPAQQMPPQPRHGVRVKIARPAPPPVQPRPQARPQPMDDDSIWNRYAD